jgi:hypothetical protein
MLRLIRDQNRVRAGLDMPGVFLVNLEMPIGQAIDELVVAIEWSPPEDWKDTVTYFPL